MSTEFSLILKILGILIAVSYTIFKFRVLSEIISGFNNWKNNKRNKKDIELRNKVDKYLANYNLNKVDENIKQNSYNLINPINFHILRIIISNNRYAIYFSNLGGTASNIEIHSDDVDNISIEPNNIIKNGESASIIFFDNSKKSNYVFLMSYFDENSNRISKKYSFLVNKEKITEIF